MVPSALGIDPSYACSGLVWLDYTCRVEHHVKIALPPSADRLLLAFKRFYDAISARRPRMAVVEDLAYGVPSRHVLVKLTKLLAVIELVLQALKIDYLVVSATMPRKWLCGKGNADKVEVAKELRRRYGVSFEADKGHDLSDAALLAAWAVQTKGGTA